MTRQAAASFASPAARHAQDPARALHAHLQQCHQARAPWFGIALAAERLHALVAPRPATTIALAALTLGLALYGL